MIFYSVISVQFQVIMIMLLNIAMKVIGKYLNANEVWKLIRARIKEMVKKVNVVKAALPQAKIPLEIPVR